MIFFQPAGKRHHNLWTEEWSALIMMGTPVEWRALSTIEHSRRWKFYSSSSDVEGVFGLSGGHFRDFVPIKKATMDRCYFGIFSERHFRHAPATKCSAFFLFRCCLLFCRIFDVKATSWITVHKNHCLLTGFSRYSSALRSNPNHVFWLRPHVFLSNHLELVGFGPNHFCHPLETLQDLRNNLIM